MNYPKKGEVYLVCLDPTVGSEINKKRPAVIVSNDIGNEISRRVIVAPITSSVSKIFPFEVAIEIKDKKGKVLLDQVRSVDKSRLEKKIAEVDFEIVQQINDALKIVFALR